MVDMEKRVKMLEKDNQHYRENAKNTQILQEQIHLHEAKLERYKRYDHFKLHW